MAKNAKTTTAPATAGPELDHNALYRVALTRSIKLGRSTVHPGPRVLLRGDALSTLIGDDPDAVNGYETFNE